MQTHIPSPQTKSLPSFLYTYMNIIYKCMDICIGTSHIVLALYSHTYMYIYIQNHIHLHTNSLTSPIRKTGFTYEIYIYQDMAYILPRSSFQKLGLSAQYLRTHLSSLTSTLTTIRTDAERTPLTERGIIMFLQIYNIQSRSRSWSRSLSRSQSTVTVKVTVKVTIKVTVTATDKVTGKVTVTVTVTVKVTVTATATDAATDKVTVTVTVTVMVMVTDKVKVV
jgi:hypothetical protein